jgi:hypothetical protein
LTSFAYAVGDGQSRNNQRTELNLWSKFNNNYPDTISISNFTTRTNQVSAVEIISGDEDNVFNPDFLLSNESVLDIGIGNVISFDIDYDHIEGVTVEIKVKGEDGKIKQIPTFDLNEISHQDFLNSTNGLKTFYSLPYLFPSLESPKLKANYIHYFENGSRPFTHPVEANLTISFAPDSETTVYYKTKVNVTN